jgi:AmmeMemoRadiSam system protein B
MVNTVRMPAVSGQFYDADPRRLTSQIEQYVDVTQSKKDCIGIVSPHAGFMYSGPVAGAVYSCINIPETVLLIGPNHTGMGKRIALMSAGEWVIPSGSMTIDEDFASELSGKTGIVSVDSGAHLFEHSLEVQLPFIHYFRDDTRIVPLTLMQLDIDECREVGKVVADAIKSCKERVLIVASSDMSHYVTDEQARERDKLAIDMMLDIDPEGLYDVIKRHNISMCGFIPATVMFFVARQLGAENAELVKYSTSAEISGDYDHVVGYSGIIVR